VTEPTERDLANAARRQAIADRFQQEYDQVLRWAIKAFGKGWIPSGRYYLVDKDNEDRCRRTGERPTAAATLYTVTNCVGSKRHFTVDAEGNVTEHAGYKEAFGDMLLERHPTMTIEVQGQKVHPHRYSVCWAAIERYEPRSAEQLAALRQSREAGKERRHQERFAAENPLLAQAGIKPKDVERGR